MLSNSERRMFDARFATLWGVNVSSIIAPKERHAASLERVKKGGVVNISSETFVVTDIASYTETDDNFRKKLAYKVMELTLFSLKNGETRYLEWAKDDGLEICLTEHKLTKAEMGSLTYGNGKTLTVEDIDEIADEEESIIYQGVLYSYDDDWNAKYDNTDGRKACVFICEFGDPKNTRWLTLEAWSADGKESGEWDYEVFVSHNLHPSAIEIISYGT